MNHISYRTSASSDHHVSSAELPDLSWSRVPVTDAHHDIGGVPVSLSVSSAPVLNSVPVSEFLNGLKYQLPFSPPDLDPHHGGHSHHGSPLTQHTFNMVSYDDPGSQPHTPGLPIPGYSIAPSALPILAPNPGPPRLNNKRSYQSDMSGPSTPPQAKRRKSTSKDFSMTEDDNLLLKLKDDENLPWKAIAKRFLDQGRGEFKVPTLQMRYKRLKEKMRVWDPEDINYLQQAKELLDKEYWELLSKKMLEIGCKKKIPGSACERKWKEIQHHATGLGIAPETPRSPPLDQLNSNLIMSPGRSPGRESLDGLSSVKEE